MKPIIRWLAVTVIALSILMAGSQCVSAEAVNTQQAKQAIIKSEWLSKADLDGMINHLNTSFTNAHNCLNRKLSKLSGNDPLNSLPENELNVMLSVMCYQEYIGDVEIRPKCDNTYFKQLLFITQTPATLAFISGACDYN